MSLMWLSTILLYVTGINSLEDTLNAFGDFKNWQQNRSYSFVFWHVKVYTFWKFVQYTIHGWRYNTNVKKISFRQNKRWKIKFLFSFASSNSSQFYFNWLFLYEVKLKVQFSKIVCGILHSVSFLSKIIFCSIKCIESINLKRHNSFQNKNDRRATDRLAPRPLIFNL